MRLGGKREEWKLIEVVFVEGLVLAFCQVSTMTITISGNDYSTVLMLLRLQ